MTARTVMELDEHILSSSLTWAEASSNDVYSPVMLTHTDAVLYRGPVGGRKAFS